MPPQTVAIDDEPFDSAISDSISVVSLRLGCVVATIQAKDEPAGVFFAGDPRESEARFSRREETADWAERRPGAPDGRTITLFDAMRVTSN